MSGGGKGAQQAGTTTTTQAPPAYLWPYMGSALGQAGNLFQQGGPKQYPGETVAPFNPLQEQSFAQMQRIAGSNPFGAATKYNNSILKGDFTGPEAQLEAMGQGGATNPYLDSMFNQAAGATRNQLSSEFAGSGRNVGASQALRGEQLNNLATSLYGGAYDADQSRALAANQYLSGERQGAIGNAEGLVNARTGLAQGLNAAGNQIQGQSQKLIDASKSAYDYNQNQPYKNLQWFESMLTGLQPGSQSQNPYFNNPSADTLQALLMGQQLYKGFGSKGPSGGGVAGSAGSSAGSTLAGNL